MDKIESIKKQMSELKSALAEKGGYNGEIIRKLNELKEELSLPCGSQYGTLAYAEAIGDELRAKIDETAQNFLDSMIEAKLSEVSYWKYASGDYFNPYPYDCEISELPRGRILKSVEHSERFTKNSTNSFGFNSSDQLVIQQYSGCSRGEDYNRFGVSTSMYTTSADGSIDGCNAKWYPTNKSPHRFIALNSYRPLEDKSWIYVGVSEHSWRTRHYIYNECNRIERVVSGGLHGGEKVFFDFYDFVYAEDGELEKIVSEDILIWERKGKKKKC